MQCRKKTTTKKRCQRPAVFGYYCTQHAGGGYRRGKNMIKGEEDE